MTEAEILKEFDKYIGDEMKEVKERVIGAVDYFLHEREIIERKRKCGEKVNEDDLPFMNIVLTGNPGTGKTSIAKLIAKYFKAKGILPTDRFVCKFASEMIQGVAGGTEVKIREAAEEARGGILFIDEFQGFIDVGNSSGNIAKNVMREIVCIVNNHRSDLCIILAGYKEGVEKVLRLDAGAGRRFPIKVDFRNYSVETLLKIFHSLVRQKGETVEDGVDALLSSVIESRITEEREAFGNIGYIKDILLPALERSKGKRDINSTTYTVEDVKDAFPNVAI